MIKTFNKSKYLIFFYTIFIFLIFQNHSFSNPQKSCLVFLMHGTHGQAKWPGLDSIDHNMSQVCKVIRLDMPWGRIRNYDKSYEEALKELSNKSAEYKKKGYTKIIMAGHSHGANAGMAYQAYIGDADAVIALAPGHNPDKLYKSKQNLKFNAIVDDAKKNIDSGKPDLKIRFAHPWYGHPLNVRSDILYSFFNPNGLGNMTKSCKKFKKSAPLLYIEGSKDKIKRGSDYAFNFAPKNPLNQYIVVDADHKEVPDVSGKIVLNWLRELTK
jgi:pimeloyl-ACP methyl ester carboxylesterase